MDGKEEDRAPSHRLKQQVREAKRRGDEVQQHLGLIEGKANQAAMLHDEVRTLRTRVAYLERVINRLENQVGFRLGRLPHEAIWREGDD
jgi:2-C-methyl-D-erythritol 4-phosphate cytidylyltransferase